MPKFRDNDHKFEFTRKEFEKWALNIEHKYSNFMSFNLLS